MATKMVFAKIQKPLFFIALPIEAPISLHSNKRLRWSCGLPSKSRNSDKVSKFQYKLKNSLKEKTNPEIINMNLICSKFAKDLTEKCSIFENRIKEISKIPFSRKIPWRRTFFSSGVVQLSFPESPALLKLHEDFLEMLSSYAIDIVSFSETKSTLVTALKFPFQFVTPHSAGEYNSNFFSTSQFVTLETLIPSKISNDYFAIKNGKVDDELENNTKTNFPHRSRSRWILRDSSEPFDNLQASQQVKIIFNDKFFLKLSEDFSNFSKCQTFLFFNRQSFLYRKVLSIVEQHVPTKNHNTGTERLAKFLSWPKWITIRKKGKKWKMKTKKNDNEKKKCMRNQNELLAKVLWWPRWMSTRKKVKKWKCSIRNQNATAIRM